MFAFQVLRFEVERKRAIAPDFKPVVIDGQTYRPANNGIIPVTKSVDQGLAQCFQWKEGLIFALKKAWDNSPGHGQVTAQKQHGFFKLVEGMPFNLPLIEKLGFVHAPEAGKAQLALRIIRHEAGTKQDDGSLIGSAVPKQS